MTIKKMRKAKVDIFMKCSCGAKAAVFQNGECRWYSHCPACGRLTFWANPQLTERVKGGGKLCPHEPELKPCKDGKTKTSWCRACRVRSFIPLLS